MRVLGGQVLTAFGRRRARARGPLMALYAVLSESDPASIEDLQSALGALVQQREGNKLVLHIPDAAEVALSISPAADIAKIDAVRPMPNGKDRS